MNKENSTPTQRFLPENFSAAPLLPFPLHGNSVCILDLSAQNDELSRVDLADTFSFDAYVNRKIRLAGAIAATGGYNEDRIIYTRSRHFSGEEPRSVHLGADIWTGAGTEIFAPVPGRVHSFQDNARFGDYGPTLILEHQLTNFPFYTLYGHLSHHSLSLHYPGKEIAAGDRIGWIGPYPENGDWPPHLHFQVISDLLGHTGDFPGVAAPGDREKYLTICPDPAFLLT